MSTLATRNTGKQMEIHDSAGESIAPPREFNPMQLVERAIEKGVDAATLERMMAVAEREHEARARAAFSRAISAFQAECPQIRKERTASTTKFSFQYAGFDDVMRQIRPLLSKYGIAITFTCPEIKDSMLTVVTRIRVGSHHEDSAFSVPIAKDMVVGDPQKYGATLSYAKRYSLCAALNIVVTNEDDENQLKEFVTEAQREELRGLLMKAGRTSDKQIADFLKWADADTLEEVTREKFREAKSMLQKAAKPKAVEA